MREQSRSEGCLDCVTNIGMQLKEFHQPIISPEKYQNRHGSANSNDPTGILHLIVCVHAIRLASIPAPALFQNDWSTHTDTRDEKQPCRIRCVVELHPLLASPGPPDTTALLSTIVIVTSFTSAEVERTTTWRRSS
jgi:hypothetical protein